VQPRFRELTVALQWRECVGIPRGRQPLRRTRNRGISELAFHMRRQPGERPELGKPRIPCVTNAHQDSATLERTRVPARRHRISARPRRRYYWMPIICALLVFQDRSCRRRCRNCPRGWTGKRPRLPGPFFFFFFFFSALAAQRPRRFIKTHTPAGRLPLDRASPLLWWHVPALDAGGVRSTTTTREPRRRGG